MPTLARSLAAVAGLAVTVAFAPATQAAGGHGFAGGGHGFAGGGHPVSAAGWRGGHPGGGWHGDRWGHRGWGRPGVFWGGVGLGLGIGAVGYYGGWWGPYGYAPYYVDGGYYFDDPAPAVIVGPADPVVRAAPVAPSAARSPDPIFYPNKGQSAAVTESDRRDCNRWATTQSGAMADASIFQRATLACMEGRGYTVK